MLGSTSLARRLLTWTTWHVRHASRIFSLVLSFFCEYGCLPLYVFQNAFATACMHKIWRDMIVHLLSYQHHTNVIVNHMNSYSLCKCLCLCMGCFMPYDAIWQWNAFEMHYRAAYEMIWYSMQISYKHHIQHMNIWHGHMINIHIILNHIESYSRGRWPCLGAGHMMPYDAIWYIVVYEMRYPHIWHDII